MTLHLNLITEDEWKQARAKSIHKEKWPASHWISTLGNIITTLRDQYSGRFEYRADNHGSMCKNTLCVSETSPVFQLFCIHSDSFTNQADFQNLTYWKHSSIDSNIFTIFNSYNLNKYETGSIHELDFDNFILFPLQSLQPNFDITTFTDIIKWSNNNKKRMLLKLHPFTEPNNYIFDILISMKNAGWLKHVKIVTHRYNINYLIDRSSSVWLFNSGVALNAIIRGKPVATFRKSRYNPLCTMVKSPEEADKVCYPNDDLLYQYLSWFYHRYTIDIGADSAISRFTELFDYYYKYNNSLESYMSKNWK
jgi:hypothetical protein